MLGLSLRSRKTAFLPSHNLSIHSWMRCWTVERTKYYYECVVALNEKCLAELSANRAASLHPGRPASQVAEASPTRTQRPASITPPCHPEQASDSGIGSWAARRWLYQPVGLRPNLWHGAGAHRPSPLGAGRPPTDSEDRRVVESGTLRGICWYFVLRSSWLITLYAFTADGCSGPPRGKAYYHLLEAV